MLILVIIKASFIVRESGRQKETFSLMKLDTMDITSSHQSMLEINLKKHSAMKWYIVKKSLRYSKFTKKNVLLSWKVWNQNYKTSKPHSSRSYTKLYWWISHHELFDKRHENRFTTMCGQFMKHWYIIWYIKLWNSWRKASRHYCLSISFVKQKRVCFIAAL